MNLLEQYKNGKRDFDLKDIINFHFSEPEKFKEFHRLKSLVYESKVLELLQEEVGTNFTIEDKPNWGRIFVFEKEGKKVFTNDMNTSQTRLIIYLYSKEYSCWKFGTPQSEIDEREAKTAKFLASDTYKIAMGIK